MSELEHRRRDIDLPPALLSLVDRLPEAAVLVGSETGKVVHVSPQFGRFSGWAPDEVVGKRVEAIVPRDLRHHHARLRSNWHGQRNGHDAALTDTQLLLADGRQIPVRITLSSVPWGDDQTFILAIVSDPEAADKLARDLADQRDQARKHSELLQALHVFGTEIASQHDPEAVAGLTAKYLQQAIAAESVGVLSWDEGARRLRTVGTAGLGEGTVQEVLPNQGVSWLAFEQGRPVVVNDYQNLPNAIPAGRARGVRAAFSVPLRVSDRSVGAVSISSVSPRTFTESEVDLAQMVANLAGPAIQATRLYESLETTNQQLRAMFDTAPFGIARVSLSAKVEDWNPRWQEIFGYEPFEQGTVARDAFIYADDRGLEGSAFDELMQGKRERFRITRRYVRKDGSVFWGTATVSLIRDSVGNPAFGQVVIDDITDRRMAEDAIRASEALKAALVNSALEGLIAFDEQGVILEFNPAAEAMFGWRALEVAGRSVHETLVAPESLASFSQDGLLANVARAGAPIEARGKRLGGQAFPAAVSFAMTQREGKPVYLSHWIDLSDRDKAKSASEREAARARYFAAMSHDLRTPLNSILGFSELLDSESAGPLSEKQHQYLRHIETGGRHLLDLINDLLDLARADAGRIQIDPVEATISDVLEQAAASVLPVADLKRVAFIWKVEPGLKAVADTRRLLQVVLNLLSNAIKFTPAGGRVVLEAKASGPMVEISVEDTGIGIAPADLSLIFDEFVQVGEGGRRPSEGTGLGLAISKRLVQMMKGRIEVSSEVGKGSRFTVILPGSIAMTPG